MSGDLLFWICAGGLTALVVALLLRPLLARRGAGGDGPAPSDSGEAPRSPAAYDLTVYRDQLAEIDRDLARGVLGATEGDAARLEVERRILAAADRPGPALDGRRGPVSRAWLAGGIALALPLLALVLYAGLGAPGLPGAPADGRRAALDAAVGDAGMPGPDGPDMASLVDELAGRMAERPDDVRGWLLLARSYGSLGRYQDSAGAYASAIAHGAADGAQGAAVQSAYGEALTAAADGQITAAAKAAFDSALARDPADPRARFYLALAKAQGGDVEAALADWVTLEAEAPADAPWRGAVTEQIERAAAQLGRDPATLPGRAGPPSVAAGQPPGPDESDVAAATDMTPEERDAFIRSMVERLAARLAATPDDLDGWLRLARAYGVLGEADEAEMAWARAAALAPARADVQLGYAQALRETSVDDAPLPPEFAAAVARARQLEPDNPLGLYLGGLAESAAGNPAGARALWERLRGMLPEGSPERTEIETRLATLPAS